MARLERYALRSVSDSYGAYGASLESRGILSLAGVRRMFYLLLQRPLWRYTLYAID